MDSLGDFIMSAINMPREELKGIEFLDPGSIKKFPGDKSVVLDILAPLDDLENAGSKRKGWWGIVVIDKKDKTTGKTEQVKPLQWIPGKEGVYYVSCTTLQDGPDDYQTSYVNSLTVPYIVYKDSTAMGNIFLVVRRNRANKIVRSSFAMSADQNSKTGFPYANANTWGEGSSKLHKNLGSTQSTRNIDFEGDHGDTFYVYMLTSNEPFRKKAKWNEASITAKGKTSYEMSSGK